MSRKRISMMVLLCCAVLFSSCQRAEVTPKADANMPNPASVYCEQNDGRLDLRQDASGGVTGICVFDDGSECDEWAFYRGECKPGAIPTVVKDLAEDGWKVYRNEALGYSFHYPTDASIVQNDEPLKSITISGPVVNGDAWPQITISHPTDREDYRLPEGADLAAWVAEHHLMADDRLEDVQIAGTTALHGRHDRSPQSYAYDRYIFAHNGQIYMIVIGHAGDREDWDLYQHFLDSFKFNS